MLAPLLVVALAAGGGDAQKAATLEAWGDLAGARKEVEAALATDPTDAAALFVAACLELEAGDPEAAEARAMELANARPVDHVKVLLTLARRQRNVPDDSLRDAVVLAWKLAGKPDLSGEELPGLDESLWFDLRTPERGLAEAEPGVRFLFGPLDGPRRKADAFVASLHPEQNPVSLNHELLDFFHRSEGALDAEEAAAVARLGRALVAAEPGNGYWELAAWSAAGPGDAPLVPPDLERLEHAAAQPRFELPRAALMGELRELARRFDPEHAACRAGMAGLQLGTPYLALQMRLKATTWAGRDGAKRKQRAGRVAMAIGRRLAASRTFLERLVGLSLVEQGARLTGDTRGIARAEAESKAARDWYHRAMDASKRAGRWPFSAMCREWSPDEVEYFGRFLD